MNIKYMKYVFFIEAGLLTTGNGEEKQQFINDWHANWYT